MTAITRNLPWFIKDLGVAIVGQVCPHARAWARVITRFVEMLCFSCRELGLARRRVLEVLVVKGPWGGDCRWRIYHEGSAIATQYVFSPLRVLNQRAFSVTSRTRDISVTFWGPSWRPRSVKRDSF